MTTDWTDIISSSFQTVWQEIVLALPNVFGAIIIFILGWFIANSVGGLVNQIISALKIDAQLVKLGLEKPLARAGLRLNAGFFLGELVRWFLIIGFLLIAVNILGLDQVSIFLRDVLGYLPKVVIAAIILLIAAVVANFMQKVVVSSVAAAGLVSAKFLGIVTKWAILIFAFLTALEQMSVASNFIQTLYIGLIAMLSLAGGLAFGLGGKDHANELIASLKREISHREHEQK